MRFLRRSSVDFNLVGRPHRESGSYRLWFYTVTLGTGKRLFGSGTVPAALTLTGTKTTSTGVVISTYRRAGRPKYGSFEAEVREDWEAFKRSSD